MSRDDKCDLSILARRLPGCAAMLARSFKALSSNTSSRSPSAFTASSAAEVGKIARFPETQDQGGVEGAGMEEGARGGPKAGREGGREGKGGAGELQQTPEREKRREECAENRQAANERIGQAENERRDQAANERIGQPPSHLAAG